MKCLFTRRCITNKYGSPLGCLGCRVLPSPGFQIGNLYLYALATNRISDLTAKVNVARAVPSSPYRLAYSEETRKLGDQSTRVLRVRSLE